MGIFSREGGTGGNIVLGTTEPEGVRGNVVLGTNIPDPEPLSVLGNDNISPPFTTRITKPPKFPVMLGEPDPVGPSRNTSRTRPGNRPSGRV